ncbi:GNAT family N-acetyltransferase [Actinoplanes sp. M2I2]|uniref:GNAT family N-acetyltransferase n=1 Tax=Actinoplanes sp. M2I2 TaxID=1734444 RepID=UPI002021E332|nr:hypothetical protein [Actinoplanes sp. M2I2]
MTARTPAGSDGFAGYLASLARSWEALAAPHDDAAVTRGDGFFAARFARHPVLNNAVLLDPARVGDARAVFEGTGSYAIWSADEPAGAALAAAGLRRDMTTVPMRADLAALDEAPGPDDGVLVEVDPGVVATICEVDDELLRDVPGLLAFATAGHESCLVLLDAGDDVNVSFVETRPADRRRGLARAVLRRALWEARRRGYASASLQSTEMAETLYAGAGFVPVGRWQEWVP